MKVVLEELESRRIFSRVKNRKCALAAPASNELPTLPLRHDPSRLRRLPPRAYGKWVVVEFIVTPAPRKLKLIPIYPSPE